MIPLVPQNISQTLAEPDHAAQQHSQSVCKQLTNFIETQGGLISFDEYMRFVLYEPGLGYYSAGSRKFGESGDFITAPELSPLFSMCIAAQCEQVFTQISANILELGAGSGVMARDILLTLNKRGCLPEKYFILEVSADLRERQQALLQESIPEFFEHIIWLDSLPEKFEGMVVANEVLDALPAKRFILEDKNIFEQYVEVKDEQFVLQKGSASEELSLYVENKVLPLFEQLPESYESEYNVSINPWIKSLADSLHKGIILFIDYGETRREYYHPQRISGSLLCHYQHHAHDDVFLYPGLQDITVSVDFTHVVETAVDAGLGLAGFTNQAFFLLANGLEEFSAQNSNLNTQVQSEQAHQLRRLTMPGEMGERFKVMGLRKNNDIVLQGFSLNDQSMRL